MTDAVVKVLAVAVLGAESTGKTQLAEAMGRALSARGHAVAVVSEWLREWCDIEGRTPRPDEQAAIAETQSRRVLDATARLAAVASSLPAFVIADTTPLMTAIYSDWLFADASLYPMALAHQRGFSHTLVTGLDLPWVADGLQRDGPQVREPIDALLRRKLADGGIPFQVIYGSGEERMNHALQACHLHASLPFRGRVGVGAIPAPWVWACDKCSDPACEHRLFSRLATGSSNG